MKTGGRQSPETIEKLRANHRGGGRGDPPYQRSAVLALCQFSDPGQANRAQWRAITQAIHTKLGGGKIVFGVNLVLASVLAKLRKRVGGKLTKENVTAWAESAYGKSLVGGDYQPPPRPAVAERIVVWLAEYAGQLAAARKFCHAVGAANAKDVLDGYLRIFEDSP